MFILVLLPCSSVVFALTPPPQAASGSLSADLAVLVEPAPKSKVMIGWGIVFKLAGPIFGAISHEDRNLFCGKSLAP